MNTTPDETRLALWLDDELTGAELAQVEAWAAGQPGQLAAREELRAYRGAISKVLPADGDVPYGDFFNSRVLREIQDSEPAVAKVTAASAVPFWRTWLMPMAACAGMVLAFGIGKQTTTTGGATGSIVENKEALPGVYTPEDGVNAEWFASRNGGASVIVLQGVSAIPDSTDFSQTVYVPTMNEGSRTADRPNPQISSGQQ